MEYVVHQIPPALAGIFLLYQATSSHKCSSNTAGGASAVAQRRNYEFQMFRASIIQCHDCVTMNGSVETRGESHTGHDIELPEPCKLSIIHSSSDIYSFRNSYIWFSVGGHPSA